MDLDGREYFSILVFEIFRIFFPCLHSVGPSIGKF